MWCIKNMRTTPLVDRGGGTGIRGAEAGVEWRGFGDRGAGLVGEGSGDREGGESGKTVVGN